MGCRVRWRHCLQRPPSSPAAPPGTGSTHILIIGVEGEGDVGRLVERRARREGAVRRRWGGGVPGFSCVRSTHPRCSQSCTCKSTYWLQFICSLKSTPVTHSGHLQSCLTGMRAAEGEDRDAPLAHLSRLRDAHRGREPQTRAAGGAAPGRPQSTSHLNLVLSVLRQRLQLPGQVTVRT